MNLYCNLKHSLSVKGLARDIVKQLYYACILLHTLELQSEINLHTIVINKSRIKVIWHLSWKHIKFICY
jgi:hypothetical protein